jgi:hypothetical protein
MSSRFLIGIDHMFATLGGFRLDTLADERLVLTGMSVTASRDAAAIDRVIAPLDLEPKFKVYHRSAWKSNG